MSRSQLWLLRAANLMVVGTGVTYAVMLYLLEPQEEWSVVNHPWQPHVQHLHVLATPLLVFAVGLLWSRHVMVRAAGNGSAGRATGLAMLVGFVPMVVSGYSIQVATGELSREIWSGVHLATALLWTIAATAHHLGGRTRLGLHRTDRLAAFGDSPPAVNPGPFTTSHQRRTQRAITTQTPLTTLSARCVGMSPPDPDPP